MRSTFSQWMALVNEISYMVGGVEARELPISHPYQHWWETGCSAQWVARHVLGMDNG